MPQWMYCRRLSSNDWLCEMLENFAPLIWTRIRRGIKSAFSPPGTFAGSLQSWSAAAWTPRPRSAIASSTVRHCMKTTTGSLPSHEDWGGQRRQTDENKKSENGSKMKKNDLMKFEKVYIKIFGIINNFHSSK